ncbi:MAG TPA: STAS domain-containing protein [Trebonia sp.]|nr:STAS domain-containing protein [Trebonia sp.]
MSEDRFPAAWSGRTAVIAASGEIDLTNADGLREVLLSALDAGARGLVVDMTAGPGLREPRALAVQLPGVPGNALFIAGVIVPAMTRASGI